jgi:hypothetical protein
MDGLLTADTGVATTVKRHCDSGDAMLDGTAERWDNLGDAMVDDAFFLVTGELLPAFGPLLLLWVTALAALGELLVAILAVNLEDLDFPMVLYIVSC